jgi:putative ABC transport system substrate-binding protein
MSRLSRRQFVAGAGVSAGTLLAGCGPLPFQQPSPTAVKVYRVGYLNGTNPTATALVRDIFQQALAELGYWEGQNLVVEYRWGEGVDARLTAPAAELARLPVDLFVVPSPAVAQIVREATTTVPIVMVGQGDPVAAGLAASYARAGGNVTGVTNLATQLNGKRLQLLKETVPSISRVAVFWGVASGVPFPVEAWSRDAQAVGVQLHPMELRDPQEFDAAFEAAAREGADALLNGGSGPGPLAAANRVQIVQLAARYGWPAMYDARQYVVEGGLMAYAASLTDLWHRAAVYVDKILKGANPADLPVEQPQRYDFVVNMKTARELGIIFPNETTLQITEVIE